MKKDIHPKYYPEAKVICACGNTWTTGSTQEEIHTEMCSVCHPFFTGEQRIVDTAGQVDRFQRRKERADKMVAEKSQRDLTRPKRGESLFEFVTEEKPTAQETLQAEFPDVARRVAESEAQQAAAQAAAQAASQVAQAAGDEKSRPERMRRPPRRGRPESSGERRAPPRSRPAKATEESKPGAESAA